uniref:Receptor ligand binding region domain-containing protein n=2 Tax=Lepisosteus oculatus TaxID=7918 RepID=W5NKL4_LEPOC
MAIKTALKFMEDQRDSFENCFPLRSDYSNYESNVKAVIGESYSEISIAVARLLTIALIPQISYSSTSEVLSTKSKFPSFLRTIPSDAHQTKAIALLAVNERWNSIGVIGSNDEYGKYGIEGFIDHATKYKLCIAFKEILPALFSQNDTETRSVLNNLMKTIDESS